MLVGFLVMMVFSTPLMAQGICDDVVIRALEQVSENCKSPSLNSVCYGNSLIFAQARTGISLSFATEGDIAPIDAFSGINHSPLDENSDIWGVSLMKLQANLPGTVPGQAVDIIVFGNVAVSDVQPTAFRFSSGIGASSCAQAEINGVMVRTPEGVAEVSLTINEVEISLGSTALISADATNGMNITMLDGTANVTTQGITQQVTFSQQITIPMAQNGDNLVPSGLPTQPEPWDVNKVATVFNVYNTLNQLGEQEVPVENSGSQPSNTGPTPTLEPCTIIATQPETITRVGPGTNRGTFTFLPTNIPIPVTGKRTVNNLLWWQLDKFEATNNPYAVNELWVSSEFVQEQGDCDAVIDAAAPPIVRPPTAVPQVTPTPLTVVETPEIMPAVEPIVSLMVEDDMIPSGDCTLVFVEVEFISSAYFNGPGFVEENAVTGPEWDTMICPPMTPGDYTYTLDVYSFSGQLSQYFVTVTVIVY